MTHRYSLEKLAGGGAAVSLPECRDHLGLPATSTGHDGPLEILRVAATKFVESKTGYSLLDTNWRLGLEQFPSGGDAYPHIVIPKAVATVVDSVTYVDPDEQTQTLDDVTLSSGTPALLTPDANAWPETRLRKVDTVIVDFTAGFGSDETTVPNDFKTAVLQVVTDWFEWRGMTVGGVTPTTVPGPTQQLLTNLSWGSEFEIFWG